MLKFIYSEKATKFCEIFTFILTDTTQDKSKVKMLQNFVAFSEYMNFNKQPLNHLKSWIGQIIVKTFLEPSLGGRCLQSKMGVAPQHNYFYQN